MSTLVKASTKKGQEIAADLHRAWNKRDIYDAYDRPSRTKVEAWEAIRDRATATPGYKYNLQIVGASSHFFSTIYSYTDSDGEHIIKDTHCNTYEVII